MAYQFWPSGIAPYSAYTYITDRTTPLNHDSIMNGIARDVGWIQHNINTTHLFASGYARPTLSGFFRNINTNYLYVKNLFTRNVILNSVADPKIESLEITGTRIDVADTAFRNNTISVSDSFRGPLFSLNVSGLMYNAASVSGGIYDYQLGYNYKFLDGLFGGVIVNSGNITVDPSRKIIIENIGAFAPSGTISESGILWNSSAGHNHVDSKINGYNITDSSIDYREDLILNAKDGSIEVVSGVLDADFYTQETFYEDIGFYELDFSSSGIYTCNVPSLSGYVHDLDIGTCPMLSYNGRVYAASKTGPSGSKTQADTYLYSTDDFYTWTGELISGTWRPTTSGVASIDALVMNNASLYLLWNLKISSSGNHSCVMKVENITTGDRIQYLANVYAYGSSRYPLGLASIENNLMIYGYEYPHIYGPGIGQWDKQCDTYEYIIDTGAGGPDLSYSGVPYKFSFPFVQAFLPNTSGQFFWLDGSIGSGALSRESNYDHTVNGVVYDILPSPIGYGFSGNFGAFFGNGFSEVTSMLSTDLSYHNGQRGYFMLDDGRTYISYADLIENYSEAPILVFGNSTSYVETTKGSGIFGGCIPLVIDVDKRILPTGYGTEKNTDIFITSGVADFAPGFLHGSRSLMDTNTLFRIPTYTYKKIINHSNLFQDWPNNTGRLWSDYSNYQANSRTELINICPWLPGLLMTPFGGSGQIYYKHNSDVEPVKLLYTSMIDNSNGIIIPSGAFTDHRNYPTYFDRPIKEGFWRDKTFDWWYMSPVPVDTNPPSGAYPKTFYYMRPKCPVQHNGIVYCILEFNSGFVYTGPNGSEYIDDGIQYTDLIKYGNTIYGVGIKDDSIVVVNIRRNVSSLVPIPSSLNGTNLTPKFVIHKSMLYLGVGNGKFLVKKPSHIDLSITSNL